MACRLCCRTDKWYTEPMKLLCRVGLHRWGELTADNAGMYRTCARCGKLRESHGPGPDGWEQAWRHLPGGN
jgi:hypothetical protein